jgi:hypothetical protein
LFVDALDELHPSLKRYIPKLEQLFEVLLHPDQLKHCRFKIENTPDESIQNASLNSDVLLNAFDILQEDQSSALA